jgi:hypothetical protein
MKSIALLASLVFALVPALGCGTVDAEGPGAEYPQQPPVGYDAPERAVASSSVQPASAEALQAQGQQAQGQAGQAGQAEDVNGVAIAPQQGDVVVGAASDDTYVDTDPSALTDFKPALDPYGTWVDDSTYGTVWTPSPTVVGADFAPYVTAGHWAYEDDYVWVSDYDWGWAPFHYGRWVYIGGRGWGWIPGRTYAGAWVSWRYGYDDWGYVGWAPLPPTWYWRGGYAVGVAFVPPAPYVFCGSHDVFSPVVGSRVVTGSQVPVVAQHTRPYVPASPTVAGAGGVAAGHSLAHPTVGGPPPSLLKVPPTQVTHAPASDRGLLHAKQFAQPNTAQSLGAHAPVQSIARANPATMGNVNRSAFASPGVPRSSMPAYGNSFGAASGRNAPVATAPQYRGVAPTPYHAAPTYSTPQRMAPYSGQSGQAYSAPHYSAPTYSAPHYSVPTYSAPHYSSPTPSYSAPHYSAPSYSAPAYHAPAQSSHPTYSAPAPVSRPSGGGGFRGGASFRGRR